MMKAFKSCKKLIPADKSGGFSLIEVLLGIAVFSIGILAVSSMQVRAINASNAAGRSLAGENMVVDQIEQFKNVRWLENDGDSLNDDPNLQDTDGDGVAGLDHIDGDADYAVVIADGEYTIFYNVANDDVEPNTQTIRMLINYRAGGENVTQVLTFLKAKDV
jgi:prepilin-type N-terminal cleavage/methylation domain-containing protein